MKYIVVEQAITFHKNRNRLTPGGFGALRLSGFIQNNPMRFAIGSITELITIIQSIIPEYSSLAGLEYFVFQYLYSEIENSLEDITMNDDNIARECVYRIVSMLSLRLWWNTMIYNENTLLYVSMTLPFHVENIVKVLPFWFHIQNTINDNNTSCTVLHVTIPIWNSFVEFVKAFRMWFINRRNQRAR